MGETKQATKEIKFVTENPLLSIPKVAAGEEKRATGAAGAAGGRKTKKRRKKRTKKKGKYNKCVKFFTKRHRVTKKKALKMCKVLFG